MAKNDEKEDQVDGVVPCCLENKRLVIKFYPKQRGFITNAKHILYGGMLEGSVRVLPTPINRNGDYKNVLTNDEKTYLEERMQLGKDALSVYKKQDNYWDNVKVKLEKGENYFDMSSPEDYIKAKVAMAHDNIVAKSFDEINHKVTTMFYVVKEGEKEQESHRKLTAKQEAYKLYGKIEDEREILDYICKAVRGATSTRTTKLSTVQGWIGDIIENNTKEFLLVAGDKQLKTKILIDHGVMSGAVRFIEGQYLTAEGKPLCTSGEASLQAAANYLDMPVNQPTRLKIETRNKIAE
jgi:hypothetical protein